MDSTSPQISLVVKSASQTSHSSSQHSLTAAATTLLPGSGHGVGVVRHGSGTGSASTPETESSQTTDTTGSLERDDDNKILGMDKDGSTNQVDDEEEPPPPPVAARPERTKSIVIWVLSVQIFHKHHFGILEKKSH